MRSASSSGRVNSPQEELIVGFSAPPKDEKPGRGFGEITSILLKQMMESFISDLLVFWRNCFGQHFL